MIDIILIGVVLFVVAFASGYIYISKKKGKKCIGCPGGCNGECGCKK